MGRRIDMRLKGVREVRFLSPVFAATALICLNALAQTAATTPVLLRIVLPHAVMCGSDRHLEVEAELRNASGRAIALSPAGLLAHISFTNRASSLEDGFRTKASSNDPLPGWKSNKVVTLAPGMSYRQTLRLELDPDFFSVGVYRVQISFSGRYGGGKKEGLFVGAVDSNEALFEVNDCQPETKP
jgi:hypothetical protein